MKIEILFPEFCNLYGDLQNMRFLKQCLPDAEFYETQLGTAPKFAEESVNLIYMGPMTEKNQRKVIAALLPHREKLKELIAGGTVFLFTGNAMEVLLEQIEYKDEKLTAQGLNLYPLRAEVNLFKRYNGKVLGKLEDIEIVGFQNQFSRVYGDNSGFRFLKCMRGYGLNNDSYQEGIRDYHFIGTSLLGPILIMNPKFTRYLLNLIGAEDAVIPFEAELQKAYELRLQEFKDPKLPFH